MARRTKQNSITSAELLAQVDPENMRLKNDFLDYLRSIGRSEGTIAGYDNDISIFMVWNLKNNENKSFVKLSKRDIISYQNWLLNENQNSPARVRRLKAALSSMSNYIENILDDEYENFRPIINKVESPINKPIREKTILSEEQVVLLLETLVEQEEYQKACAVALAAYGGARKSEIVRFKASYFTDENIIYGSLYKTPERIITKGRGGGKLLHKYVIASKFKKYLDLWVAQREADGVDSDWLFVSQNNGKWEQLKSSTLNSWATTYSRILGVDVYNHAYRHFFTTYLRQNGGLPDSVIATIIGWDSIEMTRIYDDTPEDEHIGKYFDENGIKKVEQKDIGDIT